MNASEKFVAVLKAAKAYLDLYDTPPDAGSTWEVAGNVIDQNNARDDARTRLKNAVENWGAVE
ncbi:MAG: hypothetical protein IIB38_12590 [Candidatus Hydrogenedentes bacterium]|nr:hypothetical protein [Candidatus Hydrogenedentota bacterium]